jgi:hypothetical protein
MPVSLELAVRRDGRQSERTWARKQRNASRWEPFPNNASEDCEVLSVLSWTVKCSHELYKCAITNPKPVYSHTITWQYILILEVKKRDVSRVSGFIPLTSLLLVGKSIHMTSLNRGWYQVQVIFFSCWIMFASGTLNHTTNTFYFAALKLLGLQF